MQKTNDKIHEPTRLALDFWIIDNKKTSHIVRLLRTPPTVDPYFLEERPPSFLEERITS